jgi:hypothetical protein
MSPVCNLSVTSLPAIPYHEWQRQIFIAQEGTALNGPWGGSGATYSVCENVAILPALITRDLVKTALWIEEA